jgi:murein endopeptidase
MGHLLAALFCLGLGACKAPVEQLDESLSVRRPVETKPETPLQSRKRQGPRVTYTVARGGTLLDVANLYKLDHDEMLALNPEIEPRSELPPNTEVVVYARGDENSESVGLPYAGRLEGALPMPNGPGRTITAERWKTWGSESTIRQLDRVLSRWATVHPNWPAVLVGNISTRRGGPIEPHKSHQSGRDVDLGYVARNGVDASSWQKMNAKNLDTDKTWVLIQSLVAESDVEVIYVDRNIQRLLLSAAAKQGRLRSAQLRRWFEVAKGAKRGSTLIRHIPDHDDHFHVRFSCSQTEKQCRS